MADSNVGNLPDALLTSIQDGVVAERTRMCYVSKIFCFLYWCCLNAPNVLTVYGESTIMAYVLGCPVDCKVQQIFSRNKQEFDDVLHEARTENVFNEEILTPELYMDYCRGLCNNKTLLHLGKSTIGVKCSAIFHLFPLQNGAGYSEALGWD
jgi:hypothetical protein